MTEPQGIRTPKNSRPWVKISTRIAGDPDLAVLSSTARLLYLLLIAEIGGTGVGDMLLIKGRGRSLQRLAARMSLDEEDALRALNELVDEEMIELLHVTADGVRRHAVRVPKFRNHQEGATAAERQQASRAKRRGQPAPEQPGVLLSNISKFPGAITWVADCYPGSHVDVTLQSRDCSVLEVEVEEEVDREEEEESTSNPVSKKQGNPADITPACALSPIRDTFPRPEPISDAELDLIESDYPPGSGRGFDGPTRARIRRLVDDRQATAKHLHEQAAAYAAVIRQTGQKVTTPFNFYGSTIDAKWRSNFVVPAPPESEHATSALKAVEILARRGV